MFTRFLGVLWTRGVFLLLLNTARSVMQVTVKFFNRSMKNPKRLDWKLVYSGFAICSFLQLHLEEYECFRYFFSRQRSCLVA